MRGKTLASSSCFYALQAPAPCGVGSGGKLESILILFFWNLLSLENVSEEPSVVLASLIFALSLLVCVDSLSSSIGMSPLPCVVLSLSLLLVSCSY